MFYQTKITFTIISTAGIEIMSNKCQKNRFLYHSIFILPLLFVIMSGCENNNNKTTPKNMSNYNQKLSKDSINQNIKDITKILYHSNGKKKFEARQRYIQQDIIVTRWDELGVRRYENILKNGSFNLHIWYASGNVMYECKNDINIDTCGFCSKWSKSGDKKEFFKLDKDCAVSFKLTDSFKQMGCIFLTGKELDINWTYSSDFLALNQLLTDLGWFPHVERSYDQSQSYENDDYTYEWKIRGKKMIGSNSKIFLNPVKDSIDTIHYHTLAQKTHWYHALCKITCPGEYYAGPNACCGGFMLFFDKKIDTSADLLKDTSLKVSEFKREPRTEANVIFNLTSSDNKLYIGRVENNAAILSENKSIHLTEVCDFNRSAMSITYSSLVSIYEIDTMKVISKYKEAACLPNSMEIPDTPINCWNNNRDGQFPTSLHLKKLIKSFRFIWLDDKPLIVNFDARKQKVIIK